MELTLGFAPVAAITALCYLLGLGLKASPLSDRWIPLGCAAWGCVLGVAAYFVAPGLLPAEDVLTAAAVGVASGCAATGLHQTVKQLGKEEQR